MRSRCRFHRLVLLLLLAALAGGCAVSRRVTRPLLGSRSIGGYSFAERPALESRSFPDESFSYLMQQPVTGVTVAAPLNTATVTITAPTAAATYDAGSASTLTTLAGTATTTASQITSCIWTNSLGGSGTATGTTSWSVPSIALVSGSNVIIVTCVGTGTPGTDVLTVTTATSAANPIDPARRVDWTTAGVTGGIPVRTTICSTLGTAGQLRTFVQSVTGAQITAAIAACPAGQVVFLNTGTYNITPATAPEAITWAGRSNVTLRGAGPDLTLIIASQNVSCLGSYAPICMSSSNLSYYGPGPPAHSANWTAGYSKGTTSITLDSVTGLSANMWLVLDQLSDTVDPGDVWVCNIINTCTEQSSTINGRTDRIQRQQVRVVSISGSGPYTVVIGTGLHMPNWRSAKSPGAFWGDAGAIPEYNGLEDLSLDADASGAYLGVSMMYTANSWVKHVRIMYVPSPRAWIQLYASEHNSILDNYFYGNNFSNNAVDQATQQNYGVDVFGGGNHLIQNNIGQHRTACWQANGDDASVWGYNHCDDNYYTSSPVFMQADMYNHEAGTGMRLMEGNTGTQIKADIIHGTSNLVTFFRNYTKCFESGKTNETGCVKMYAKNRYYNFVGNVLGNNVNQDTYEASGASFAQWPTYPTAIWAFGVWYNGIPNDTMTGTSAFRWGNYDTVTDTARWDPNEVPSGLSVLANPVPGSQTLPASMYLTAQPSWWGSMPFPACGPDVTGGDIAGVGGHCYKNPAQVCYELMLDDMAYSLDGSGKRPKRFTCTYP